jgi:hypothetical protein
MVVIDAMPKAFCTSGSAARLAQAKPRLLSLCKRLRDTYDIYVITNCIYTKEGPHGGNQLPP